MLLEGIRKQWETSSFSLSNFASIMGHNTYENSSPFLAP